MSTTAEQITELSAKIHAAEQKAASSTETDRARLAELERQAGAEAEAEQHRRATRRQAWARHYLQSGDHQAAEAQARKDVTAARRAFEQTIAAEPWVAALIDWQAAVNAQHAVTRRGEYAREITGQSVSPSTGPASVLPMIDGQVSFDPLGQMLHRLAASADETDVPAEVEQLAAVSDGTPRDPLAEAIASSPLDKSNPLAWLARNGIRLDVTRHTTEDGATTVMHRNPRAGEWVKTDDKGNILGTSWTTAETEGRPTNPIDGRQFGSVLDTERNVFTKQRVN